MSPKKVLAYSCDVAHLNVVAVTEERLREFAKGSKENPRNRAQDILF